VKLNPRYQNYIKLTKIIDRLSKQLNVMQTTHLQQPDHILNLNERHIKHNTSVSRESQTLNAKYTLQSYFDKVEMINNVKYIMTSK